MESHVDFLNQLAKIDIKTGLQNGMLLAWKATLAKHKRITVRTLLNDDVVSNGRLNLNILRAFQALTIVHLMVLDDVYKYSFRSDDEKTYNELKNKARNEMGLGKEPVNYKNISKNGSMNIHNLSKPAINIDVLLALSYEVNNGLSKIIEQRKLKSQILNEPWYDQYTTIHMIDREFNASKLPLPIYLSNNSVVTSDLNAAISTDESISDPIKLYENLVKQGDKESITLAITLAQGEFRRWKVSNKDDIPSREKQTAKRMLAFWKDKLLTFREKNIEAKKKKEENVVKDRKSKQDTSNAIALILKALGQSQGWNEYHRKIRDNYIEQVNGLYQFKNGKNRKMFLEEVKRPQYTSVNSPRASTNNHNGGARIHTFQKNKTHRTRKHCTRKHRTQKHHTRKH